jgi:cytochrome c553
MKYTIAFTVALLLLGCSGEQKSTSETTTTAAANNVATQEQHTTPKEVTKNVVAPIQKATEKNEAAPVEEAVKENVEEAAQAVVAPVEEAAKEKVEEAVQEAVAPVEKAAKEHVEAAQEVALPGTTGAHEVATAPLFDAEGTFKRKCGGCHGTAGEKPALGKSQIIKGWEATKVLTALKGYKDGSYGGAMKGLMASQVSALSPADMEALADHISKL